MLKPSEFFVGYLSDAPHMSLFLPISANQHAALVFTFDDRKFAIFLDGDQSTLFSYVGLKNANQSVGAIVKDVKIELDQTSLCDLSSLSVGSLIVHNNLISVRAKIYNQESNLPILNIQYENTDLPDEYLACFKKWQIVLENDNGHQVLLRVGPNGAIAEPS